MGLTFLLGLSCPSGVPGYFSKTILSPGTELGGGSNTSYVLSEYAHITMA